jgi:regulation of enolase protein 1 (concanavalin A-like superfamily)
MAKINFLLLFLFLILIGKPTRLIAQNTDNQKLTNIPFSLIWENKPQSFKLNANQLVIEAGEKTDMFRDPNVTYNTDNAPKLLFQPDENFVFSAAISHSFTNKWDGGAIVLKSDSLHWIKFCFEKDYTGAKRVVSVVTKDISDDCNSVELKSDKVYFKMAKADKVITLYYSENGIKWLLVRHLQFSAQVGFKIGFLAQSPTGTKCTVTFSDIRYEAKKIKDPYTGD